MDAIRKAVALNASAEKAPINQLLLLPNGSAIASGVWSIRSQIRIIAPSSVAVNFSLILKVIASPAAISAAPAK